MKFYQLSSKSPNPETPDKDWFAEAQKLTFCKGCGSARVSGKSVDVVLQTKPDTSAINFVHGVHVHIAAVNFLTHLFPEGPDKMLRLGRVFGPSSQEATGYRTIMSTACVIVRGNDRSTFRVCPDCKRVWYSAIGKRYILKRDVESGRVFETQSGNLVVGEEIARRLEPGVWKNLVVQSLVVQDEPTDGLDI